MTHVQKLPQLKITFGHFRGQGIYLIMSTSATTTESNHDAPERFPSAAAREAVTGANLAAVMCAAREAAPDLSVDITELAVFVQIIFIE